MERGFDSNINNNEGALNELSSRDGAFEQLKKREKEIERMNEVQANLAITFFSEETEIDQCLEKWIITGLSQKFRTLLEDAELKARLLSEDTKVFDEAYYEILEKLKNDHDSTNTN